MILLAIPVVLDTVLRTGLHKFSVTFSAVTIVMSFLTYVLRENEYEIE